MEVVTDHDLSDLFTIQLGLYIFGSKLYKIRAQSFKALRLSKVKFQDPFITLGRRAGEFGWLVPIQRSEFF